MKTNLFMVGALMAGVVAVPAAMAEGTTQHGAHSAHSAKAVGSTPPSSAEPVVVSPSVKASEAESNPRNVERDYQGRSMTLGGTTTGGSLRSGMPTGTKPGGASNP